MMIMMKMIMIMMDNHDVNHDENDDKKMIMGLIMMIKKKS